ncbi:hypothetical protein [Streptomyces sparsus]
MADFFTDRRIAWILTVIGTALLAGVAVEWALGEGLDVPPLALGLFLLPEGLHQLARSHDRPVLARRARLLTGFAVTAAGVVVWASLVWDWAGGRGTDWWVLAAGLLLLPAGALALAGVVAGRRSGRAGRSGRMGP